MQPDTGNADLVLIDGPKQPDLVKEMTSEEGVTDRDLELEMENFTFLHDQT